MPNSDGNGTIGSSLSDQPISDKPKTPLLNGIHQADKSKCHDNGDLPSANVNGLPASYTSVEISPSSPLSMKIIRKRHSDSEISIEGSKKAKFNDCDTPRSEPSPLVNDVTHDTQPSSTDKEETIDKVEKELENSDFQGNKNVDGPKQESTNDNESSSSSVIVIDEENDAFVSNESKESKEETAETPSPHEPIDIKESENHINEVKMEVKEELEIKIDKKDVGSQADSVSTATVKDDSLLMRADLLAMYSQNLKKATSTSLSLIQQITQNKTVHNATWQVKYHNLHSRFLHLKVSTDKMVETSVKDEKEYQSVEAQTESQGIDLKDPDCASIKVDSEASNGISSNLQSSQHHGQPLRHQGIESPSKVIGTSVSASTNHSVSSDIQSSQHSQNLQSAISQNSSVNQTQHPTSKIQHRVDNQVQQQQPQHLLLLSPRNNSSTLQNTRVVTISTGSNVIDLTDDDASSLTPAPTSQIRNPTVAANPPPASRLSNRQGAVHNDTNRVRHPMPLPRMSSASVSHGCCRGLPTPSPQLTVSRTDDGVCLQWNIPNYSASIYSKIKRYRLFNYSQTAQSVFYSFQNPWKEIGSVDSMDLPMACTLTQIQENSIYYFAIRPVDEYERLGSWSNTATIEMTTLES